MLLFLSYIVTLDRILQKTGDAMHLPFFLERMTGIEPAYSAWEADVLPLNYIRRTMVLYRAAFDLSSKDLLFYRRARNLRRLLPFGTNICYTDS